MSVLAINCYLCRLCATKQINNEKTDFRTVSGSLCRGPRVLRKWPDQGRTPAGELCRGDHPRTRSFGHHRQWQGSFEPVPFRRRPGRRHLLGTELRIQGNLQRTGRSRRARIRLYQLRPLGPHRQPGFHFRLRCQARRCALLSGRHDRRGIPGFQGSRQEQSLHADPPQGGRFPGDGLVPRRL